MINVGQGCSGEAGKLPAFTSIGCYPLVYLVAFGPARGGEAWDVWCAACCNTEDDADALAIGTDVNWEDPELHCDCCGKRIESACAEPSEAIA